MPEGKPTLPARGRDCQPTDDREATLVRLLSDLVAIDSVNSSLPGGGRGEREVAEYVAKYCSDLGLEVRFQDVLPGRPNVLAQLRPPGARRTLILESHMDTMTLAPMGDRALIPEVREGRLYGRGSCDTKGSLAAMLNALKQLSGESQLLTNVLLLGAMGEESGFEGITAAIRSGLTADGAVVGEPTDLQVVVAHKGCLRWRMRTIGKAAHSSRPTEGDNAIYQMTAVIDWLRCEIEPRLGSRSHPLLGSPTISVGRIWGGLVVNVIPDSCTVEIDRRVLPGDTSAAILADLDEALERLRADHPEIKVEREAPFLDDLPLDTPVDTAIVQVALAARQAVVGPAKPIGVPYGTDASKLDALGHVPSIVLGPGSILQAHTADEYVPIAELVAAAELYAEIAWRFARH